MIMKTFAPLWVVNLILTLSSLVLAIYVLLLCLGVNQPGSPLRTVVIWSFVIGTLIYKRQIKIAEIAHERAARLQELQEK
jgi:hypothetical protein